MGKKYLSVFLVTVCVLLLYLLGFFAFLLLSVDATFNSVLIHEPLKSVLSWFVSVATFVGLVFPVAGVVLILGLVFFYKRPCEDRSASLQELPPLNPKICVVLTAYDDELSIGGAVSDFISQDNVAQVIVVDNNSGDATEMKAREAGAIVVKERMQGYGYACIRGLRETLRTDANICVLAEGDGTFRGSDIKKLVPYLDNVDMVVGTRTTKELINQNSQLNWFYLWGNIFLAKLIQIKFFDARHFGTVRLTDVGCTMRAIRVEALHRIIDKLTVGGHHFSPHMIMVSIKHGLKVVEAPITFGERIGVSKGAGKDKWTATKVGLKMLWHILAY